MHRYPSSVRAQHGLTFISLLVVLSIALFFGLLGMKMVPVYIENFAVREVLEQVAQDRASRDLGNRQLKRALLRRFRINGIYDFPSEQIRIRKVRGGREVVVDYEVRKPVIGNVSVVMAFHEKMVLPE